MTIPPCNVFRLGAVTEFLSGLNIRMLKLQSLVLAALISVLPVAAKTEGDQRAGDEKAGIASEILLNIQEEAKKLQAMTPDQQNRYLARWALATMDLGLAHGDFRMVA